MNKASTAEIGERIAKYLCPCSYVFRLFAGLIRLVVPGRAGQAPKA